MNNHQYENIYNQIAQASKTNQLVVFIGAGMSNNFGFPTWNGLIKQMYGELMREETAADRQFDNDELLRIPQALRSKNIIAYNRILKECFGAQRVTDGSNPMLDIIFKLKPKHVITTNFDTLIETYLRDKENAIYEDDNARDGYRRLVHNPISYHYTTIVKDGDLVTADANHLLLKIHGDVQNMDSLVLCEDDYLGYSDSHVLMENFIKSLLINHTFLFVGYGVGDSNLKMIMKWVDNIVSRQKGNIENRKKHILIYTENEKMDELHRMYLEQKQIQVLEYSDIPEEFREKEVQEFPDERGKNLFRMLQAVAAKKQVVQIDNYKLRKMFAYFRDRKYIHIWEVCRWLNIATYEAEKIETTLLLEKDGMLEPWIKSIVQLAKSGEEFAEDAKVFLGKFCIERYGYRRSNIQEEFPYTYDSTLEYLCMTSNLDELYKYVKRGKNFSYGEKAHWALYIDNHGEANKWMEKQWNSERKLTRYEQVRFIYNVQQNFDLEEKYKVSFRELWDGIGDIERGKLAVVEEYVNGCAKTYHTLGIEADKIRLRYSVKRPRGEDFYDPQEFLSCRWNVIEIVRNLILNGFYITGLWPSTYLYSGINELMKSYVEVLLFFLSTECKHKPKWFYVYPGDIYIMIYFIERDDLKRLLDRYHIKRLELNDHLRQILWENCYNLLQFASKRIKTSAREGHLCSRKMEKCMMLMNRVEWQSEESLSIIEAIFEYLSYLILADKEKRTFSLSVQSLYEFLDNQKAPECKEIIFVRAWNLLQKLMKEFLQEDVANPNSKFLDENVEWYRDTGALSWMVACQEKVVHKRLAVQVWKVYQQRIWKNSFWLLSDIYELVGKKIKREISAYAHNKIYALNPEQIRAFLRKGILRYEEDVEDALVKKCIAFSKLSEKQRTYTISSEKPLIHILRLWQDGIIKDVEAFRPFKELDSWFSFVCFPEEFDYENFDVQGWCTWLELEQYRKKAFQDNRELLKRKFEEALDAGAGEDVRRIYYKYVE